MRSPWRNEASRRRLQTCLHCSVPAAGLISILCGTLLVISVLTVGVLSMGAVFIPVAVLGGIAVLWLIVGGLIGSCIYEDTDEAGRRVTGIAPSRPTPFAARRRAAFVSQLPHVESVDEGERTCSICLCETPPGRVILQCGHKFHEQCISSWMTRARFARCPLCRSGLTTPQVRPATGDSASDPVRSCEPVSSSTEIV
jgi:hypothetical protein